jgi:hypothetical protein
MSNTCADARQCAFGLVLCSGGAGEEEKANEGT